jgi:hypothetical protein
MGHSKPEKILPRPLSAKQQTILTERSFHYCIALKNALFFRQPSGVELRPIFDKKQIAIGKWPDLGEASPNLDRSTPGCLTPASQKRTCRGPRAPLAHDDRLRRGDYCAARTFTSYDPSAEAWGLGLGLGGPWVAQAWPKGHPSVAQGRPKGRFTKVLCLQQKLEKGRVGEEESPESPTSPTSRGIEKGDTLPRINTDEGRRCHTSIAKVGDRDPSLRKERFGSGFQKRASESWALPHTPAERAPVIPGHRLPSAPCCHDTSA